MNPDFCDSDLRRGLQSSCSVSPQTWRCKVLGPKNMAAEALQEASTTSDTRYPHIGIQELPVQACLSGRGAAVPSRSEAPGFRATADQADGSARKG